MFFFWKSFNFESCAIVQSFFITADAYNRPINSEFGKGEKREGTRDEEKEKKRGGKRGNRAQLERDPAGLSKRGKFRFLIGVSCSLYR